MELVQVLLDEVQITDHRQRSDMGDLQALAKSMMDNKQLTPIVIDREKKLIAGERRMKAARLNGWISIWAVYRDTMDAVDREVLELEENVRRKQLNWQEEQKAIARIHQMRQAIDPNWGQLQTAQALDAGSDRLPDQRNVSNAIKLNKMMQLFPEIAAAKTVRQALNMAKAKAKHITRAHDVSARPERFQQVSEKIYLGDSVDVIKEFEDESIDLVLTDPPFGIDFDSRIAGTVGEENAYKDDTDRYRRLLGMAPDLYRVVKADGWLVWFFGMTWYRECVDAFQDAGFAVDPIPLVWDRSDGRCFTNVPNRWYPKGYDVALHCIKGDPHVVERPKSNILRYMPVGTSDREFLVERPVELYESIINNLTIRGQLVADFFTGSGSVLAAAASLGRDYVGVEQNEERRAGAISKVRAHLAD